MQPSKQRLHAESVFLSSAIFYRPPSFFITPVPRRLRVFMRIPVKAINYSSRRRSPVPAIAITSRGLVMTRGVTAQRVVSLADDAGEVEDRVGALRDQLGGFAGHGEIARRGCNRGPRCAARRLANRHRAQNHRQHEMTQQELTATGSLLLNTRVGTPGRSPADTTETPP